MALVKVCICRDEMEAHLLKGLLEAEGIPATVTGEALQTARGELPLSPLTLPSVWIRTEDLERAGPVLSRFEQARTAEAEDLASAVQDARAETWTCPRCGEVHSGQFSQCWKCLTPRPGGASAPAARAEITLTVSTWCFKHVLRYAAPERTIEEIRSLGYQPELWLNWDLQPDFHDRANWSRVRELVGPSGALSFHTRNDRGRMLEEVEMLAELSGRVLVVHPIVCSVPGREEVEPDLPFIRDLAAAARDCGVLLALENIHGRAFLDRTLEGVETFDRRGGLGICIDIGHAELRADQPGESAVELIRDYADVLLHLHVHDVRDGRDHVPLGTGQIDYAAVVEALRSAGFHGTAAVEIQDADPVATVRGTWDFLRPLLGDDLRR